MLKLDDLPVDKIKHFMGCAAIVFALHLIGVPAFWGFAVAVGIGAWKEWVHDASGKGTVDINDFHADWLGALAAVLFITLL